MWLFHACCQVLPEESAQSIASGTAKRPTGRVVGIIRRNWRTRGYAGSIQPAKRGGFANSVAHVLFVPVERKFPMIRLQTRQVRRYLETQCIQVCQERQSVRAH